MDRFTNYTTGFERRLRSIEGRSPLTIKSYCKKVEDFLNWLSLERGIRAKDSQHTSQGFTVDTITRQDVEAFLEYCFYKGNKNSTRLTKLIALRKFFIYLAYEGVLGEDVMVNIPRPKVNKGCVQKLTKKEILNLFAVMDPHTEQGLRDINILILGVFCGLRIGEIVRLNLGDIMEEEGELDISVRNTKGGSSRVVYLWKAPSMLIRQWLAIRALQGAGRADPPSYIVQEGWQAYAAEDNACGDL